MTKSVQYLFDPLCGWCYGATRTVAALLDTPGIAVELLPTGLFAQRPRPMDEEFAAYAWSNDQRIERLTGQAFSQRYRDVVLGDRQQMFDSGPATLALTAASLAGPSQEFAALKAIQHARYVGGLDVTAVATLAGLLRECGLEEAAALLQSDAATLHDENRARTARAQELMRQAGANGVPSFVLTSGTRHTLLNASAAYGDSQVFIRQILAA